MQGAFAQGILFVLGVVTAGTGFLLVVFLANALLSPHDPSASKDSPYECGMEQAGEPWTAPRLRFSTIAALFVLFDAEAVLLFSVATGLRGHVTALLEVATFVAFLALGLAYAWRKGALEWRS